MKPLKFTLLLVSLFLASLRLYASGPSQSDITAQTILIALTKEQALRFTSEYHLDTEAAKGLEDLQTLVGQKKAVVAADFAVTSKNGQRADSESGTAKLEVEPVQSPTGDVIDATLQFTYSTSMKINTTISLANGGVKFLGAFDSSETGKDVTYLGFVRLRAPK